MASAQAILDDEHDWFTAASKNVEQHVDISWNELSIRHYRHSGREQKNMIAWGCDAASPLPGIRQ